MNANTHKTREFQEQHAVAGLNVAGPLVRTTIEGLATQTCAGLDTALRNFHNASPAGGLVHGTDKEFMVRLLRAEIGEQSAINGEANAPIQNADVAAAIAAAGANADVDFRNIVHADLATLNSYARRDGMAGHRF